MGLSVHEILIAVMAVFAVLGALDRILGNRFGLGAEFEEGIHTKNQTTMIISRGLGNSIFPFRINNPPEIIIVTLER